MRRVITKRWTPLGLLLTWYIYFIVGWLLMGVGLNSHLFFRIYTLVLAASIAASLVNASVKKRRLIQRDAELAAFALNSKYTFDASGIGMVQWPMLGSIEEMRNQHEAKLRNVMQGANWTYGDFSYQQYGRTKYGDYRRATVYYGLLSMPLPRELPNVFFDSIKARGKQFRFQFAREQRHQLEGDFNKYFVTYFPPNYTIDSMSFIGPDVMWAIRDAKDYDVEIFGNHLFLYGPLYKPADQIPDIVAKATAITEALRVSAAAYRDTRLPAGQAATRVTTHGFALQRSRFWTYMVILGNIIAVVAYVILWLLSHY